jgi:hypothetical protein
LYCQYASISIYCQYVSIIFSQKTWNSEQIKQKSAILCIMLMHVIICHIGSEEGFLDERLLMFESKTDSSDYHNEMNAEYFEEWLRGILLKLQKDSILVQDNASYRSPKIEKTPTAAWRKAQIQD